MVTTLRSHGQFKYTLANRLDILKYFPGPTRRVGIYQEETSRYRRVGIYQSTVATVSYYSITYFCILYDVAEQRD